MNPPSSDPDLNKSASLFLFSFFQKSDPAFPDLRLLFSYVLSVLYSPLIKMRFTTTQYYRKIWAIYFCCWRILRKGCYSSTFGFAIPWTTYYASNALHLHIICHEDDIAQRGNQNWDSLFCQLKRCVLWHQLLIGPDLELDKYDPIDKIGQQNCDS